MLLGGRKKIRDWKGFSSSVSQPVQLELPVLNTKRWVGMGIERNKAGGQLRN